jgi:hypothetical protein
MNIEFKVLRTLYQGEFRKNSAKEIVSKINEALSYTASIVFLMSWNASDRAIKSCLFDTVPGVFRARITTPEEWIDTDEEISLFRDDEVVYTLATCENESLSLCEQDSYYLLLIEDNDYGPHSCIETLIFNKFKVETLEEG